MLGVLLCVWLSLGAAVTGRDVHVLLQLDDSVDSSAVLAAAAEAVLQVNTHWDSVLPGHRLVLLQVAAHPCSTSAACVPSTAFTSFLPTLNVSCLATLDLPTSSLVAVIAASRSFRGDVQLLKNFFSRVSVPVISVSPGAEAIAGVLQLLPPSSVLLEAVVLFAKKIHWTRLAVVTDSFHSLHVASTQHLLSLLSARNISVSPYVELGAQGEELAVERIAVYSVRAVMISAGVGTTARLLCLASAAGLVWPELVWLVHGLTALQLQSQLPCQPTSLEGLVYVSPEVFTVPGASMQHHRNTSHPVASLYANLVFDSIFLASQVVAEARAMDAQTSLFDGIGLCDGLAWDLDGLLDGEVSLLQDGLLDWKVPLLQVRNSSLVEVGVYVNHTVVLGSGLEDFPASHLQRVYPAQIPLWLSLLEVCLLFLIVTTVLSLYLCFRKHPQIRASSTSLSLLMFLGCYMLVLYLALLALSPHIAPHIDNHFNICSLRIWLSGVGISVPLIYATLLVKMLRVYHIFNHHGRLGRVSSDCVMLFFISLVLAPNVFILLLFTFFSSYRWQTQYITTLSHVEVFINCSGDYLVYYVSLCVYTVILLAAISCVAVKTRKVRLRQFRDARKVNAVLLLMVLIGVSAVILYRIFDNNQYRLQADIILHLAHCSVVILCQVFLFLPKVLPVLYHKYFMIKKNHILI